MRIILFLYLRQNEIMLNYYKWYIYKYCVDHMTVRSSGSGDVTPKVPINRGGPHLTKAPSNLPRV